jgi:hypothetical protein
VPIPEGSVLAVQTKLEGKEYLESTSDTQMPGSGGMTQLPASIMDGVFLCQWEMAGQQRPTQIEPAWG